MRTATLALLSSDPPGLTTFDAFDPESFSITSLINDALVYIDTEGEVRPALATAWKRVSPLEMDFDLRRDVRFHDGQPFDADDVVATFHAHRHPSLSASARGILSPIVGARKLSSHVVRIETAFPDAMLLRRLFVSSVYPRDVLEREGREALYARPIGTGAYRFRSYARGSEIVLDRNPEHWLGQATIDRLHIPFIRRIEWVDRLARGEVDMALNLDAHDRVRASRIAGVHVESRASAHTHWFLLANRGPLADVRVRRALNHAVDRNLLTEMITQGHGRPQLGVASEAEQGHTELPPFRYDVDVARALLADAGVSAPLVLRGLVSEGCTSLFFAIREMLARIGVRLEAEIVSRAAWLARVVKGNLTGNPYEGDFALFMLDNPVLHTLFHHYILLTSKGPFSLMRDRAYDERFLATATTYEDDAAAKAQADLERYARDEALVLFTVHDDAHAAFREGFSGTLPRSGHFDTDALTKLRIAPDAVMARPFRDDREPHGDMTTLLHATGHADAFFLPPESKLEQPAAERLWDGLRATEDRWRVQGEPMMRLVVSLEAARTNLGNVLSSTERVAIAGYTSEGRRLFANRVYTQLFGDDVPMHRRLGTCWEKIRSEVDESGSWQGPVPKPNGGRLMLTVTRARDGQGVATGYVFVFTDFSGEEERIRTQSVRSVVENVPYGLVICDRDGRAREGYSEVCHRIFPGAAAGIPGRRLTDLLAMTPRDAASFQTLYEQLVEDVMPVELSIANLPARVTIGERVFSLVPSVIRDAGGAVESVLFTLDDVTSFIAAQAEIDDLHAVMEILRHQKAFSEFVHAFTYSLRVLALREGTEDFQAQARRELHTAKGTFGLFRLTRLAALVHRIEDRPVLDAAALREVGDELWKLIDRQNRLWNLDLAGVKQNRMEVELSSLELRLESAVSLADLKKIVGAWVDRMRRPTFGELLGPVTRLCEEHAQSTAKKVHMRIEGTDVVWPAHLDPIVSTLPHLVRNAIDHGIEAVGERAPKSETATLTLAAAELPSGGFEVRFSDDGRGISEEDVVLRAMSLGAVTLEQADRMTSEERQALVFVPGLSTAGEVSQTSGRGVGLDAVKTLVERLGGRVLLQSRAGEGTTIAMRFEPSGRARTSLVGREADLRMRSGAP